jgi:Ice-binding-like
MNQRLTARTVSTYTRTLAVAAVIVSAIVSPGCANDGGVTDDGGATGDGSATDDGAAADGGAADDDAALTGLDAKAKTDGKAKIDAKAGTTYVSLKSAGNFVVLAGSAITSNGASTVVNGNVGISPGNTISGFPPGIVNGVVHSADAVAAKAKQDLNDAYKDAAGRSGAPITVAGDLGGRTLGPGLYYSATSLGLDSGDLTLDAAGDEDAIWVFQIGSSFVTTANRNVLLVGNARPDNVFWNVGSSVTIGLGCSMVGNFLSQVSITAYTGATLEGRFLTQTGAVTLDPCTINRPKPVH